MVRRIVFSFITAFCIVLSAYGQDEDTIQTVQQLVDPVVVEVKSDTIPWVDDKVKLNKSSEQLLNSVKPFKPDPNKAVLYSAIFPGLGQIYNRKYWKLPIVYGGLIGLVYALSWNGRHYGDYTDAYRAIMNDKRLEEGYREKWVYFLNSDNQANVDNMSSADITKWQDQFKRRRDYFRRNRDLSIIGVVALYALCMIDSYVDAQLFDFDISPDLSLRLEPKVETDAFSRKAFGLQCSVKF